MTDATVLARLHASPVRRAVGLSLLVALGAILVWVAFSRPPEAPGWRLFLLSAGALALWLAERMRRATRARLELTREALCDTSGRILARVDEIRAVERGAFAFKPSGGFLLKLSAAPGAAWRPGLWWRLGRRVGVGGVTSGNEAKYMAEVIAAILAERTQARNG
ncbi:MAG: hypothetical protein OEM24_07555 [Paracoccaceae bacterium]|nr:hypothetical protein [Paracoccaceae bacterium]